MRNIITIAREHGSGGRTIGRIVADRLGIPFYDRELIYLAAKESGFAEDFVKAAEEKPSRSFLYNMYMTGQSLSISDQIFVAQSKVICDIADKGPCVIVGRCSDYILRDRKQCLRVFIHAPLEERLRRVSEEYGETAPNIRAYVEKLDKKRAGYYNSSTLQRWGAAENYHICIDSTIGLEQAADIIITASRGE